MVTPSTLSSLDTWCCCPVVPDEAEGCPEPRMDPDNPGETAACIVLIPGLALTTTETRGEFIYRLATSTSPGPRLGHFFPGQGGIVPMAGVGGGYPRLSSAVPGGVTPAGSRLSPRRGGEPREMHLGGEALCWRKKTGSNI